MQNSIQMLEYSPVGVKKAPVPSKIKVTRLIQGRQLRIKIRGNRPYSISGRQICNDLGQYNRVPQDSGFGIYCHLKPVPPPAENHEQVWSMAEVITSALAQLPARKAFRPASGSESYSSERGRTRFSNLNTPKIKKPGIIKWFRVLKKFGGVLLSHTAAHAVPSARKSLTSVFGMGTGVTS